METKNATRECCVNYFLIPFPTASLTFLYPLETKRSANSDLICDITGGPLYINAVYICNAVAPANIFSKASSPFLIPPTPIIGILPTITN